MIWGRLTIIAVSMPPAVMTSRGLVVGFRSKWVARAGEITVNEAPVSRVKVPEKTVLPEVMVTGRLMAGESGSRGNFNGGWKKRWRKGNMGNKDI